MHARMISIRLAVPALVAMAELIAAAAPAISRAAGPRPGGNWALPSSTFAHASGMSPARTVAPPAAGAEPAIASPGAVGANPALSSTPAPTGTPTPCRSSPRPRHRLAAVRPDGPGATFVPVPAVAVFGRGADNALWTYGGTPGKWNRCTGGRLTSRARRHREHPVGHYKSRRGCSRR